ncbi:MAG: HEAT repeat domain-containing protein [Promethearchaeia archaeon]
MEAAKILLFNYKSDKITDPLFWIYNHDSCVEIKTEILRFLIVLAAKERKYLNAVKKLLKKAIESDTDALQVEAIKGYAELDLKSSTLHLIRMLKSSNRNIQRSAITALKELRSKKAVPHLIKKLDSQRSDVWKLTFFALKEIEKDNLGDLLMDTLEALENSEKIEHLKRGVIKALRELGRSEASIT